MNSHHDPLGTTESPEFFWTRDPEFIPPDQDGGVSACVAQSLSTERPGELRSLLNTFLETALLMLKARAGVIRLLMPDAETLQIISAVGFSEEELEAERIVALICEECPKDAFRNGLCSTDIERCETRQQDSTSHQFRSVLSLPLDSRNSAGVLHGVFTLFFDTPQSSSGHVAIQAITFADLLSAMIEFIKSQRESKRAELLMERQSIANEIHDSLAQTINFARMNATLLNAALDKQDIPDATAHTLNIVEALQVSQRAVRSLITDFRSEIDPNGLLHALQTLCEDFRRQHPIELTCAFRIPDLDLALEHEIQTFHIVREALTNIAKHSKATHARLIVERICGYYVFTVEDNGSGEISISEGHYGLTIMRERAQRIRGDVRIHSTRGLGTTLQLFFPEPETNWRSLNEQ